MISFREKDYMYSYNKLEPPKLKMHLHNYYEFLYFKQGDGSYMVEDNIYKITEGDIFITRPQELHTLVFHSPKIYERHFFQISHAFLADLEIDLLYRINHREAGRHNRISAELVQKYGLGEYYNKIEYYILNRFPESDLMIKTYIIQFLVAVNNILSAEVPDTKRYAKNVRIELITQYISDHIESEISLEDLSQQFYINKYYLCHVFKNETGLTLKEFINTRRIARAKQLLNEGQSITDLCYRCGFNDYSTFYKTFKKLTGKSPRKFLENAVHEGG